MHSDGGTYRGEWHYDPQMKCWKRNPALAANVQDIPKGIKHKIAEDNPLRHHLMPMTYKLMEKIMALSYSACPNFNPAKPPTTTRELILWLIHLQL